MKTHVRVLQGARFSYMSGFPQGRCFQLFLIPFAKGLEHDF